MEPWLSSSASKNLTDTLRNAAETGDTNKISEELQSGACHIDAEVKTTYIKKCMYIKMVVVLCFRHTMCVFI